MWRWNDKISKIRRDINNDKIYKIKQNDTIINNPKSSKGKLLFYDNQCHLPSDNLNIKILHLIITRFMIELIHRNEFPNKLYRKDYIENGIRVMKNYLQFWFD